MRVSLLGFQFLKVGPLIDGDLELISPQSSLIEEVLRSCEHPLTRLQAPGDAEITRQQLQHFLLAAPDGHEEPDPLMGRVAQYHFWLQLRSAYVGKPGSPPIRMLGGIGLRIGSSHSIEQYYGHLGYHVFPAARGRNYAQRACRLLLPLAKAHGIDPLWITCNPDNLASRKTCERLGAVFQGIVPVPPNDPLYLRGEHQKCRYRLDLSATSPLED